MLPRFFASYYLRRDRYTDTEPSSPRGPSSRRKTTRSRDRRSVSKGLRGNALTSLLPTTRLTHVVPALPAPKLSAIVAYRSVDSFSPPFSFPSPTLSSSPSLLSFTLLFLYLLLFLFHNVNIILWTRVYRYVRVVECLHVYRDEIQNLLRDAQKIILVSEPNLSIFDLKFLSSTFDWISFSKNHSQYIFYLL